MERRELIQWLVATGGLAAFNRLPADDLVALGHDIHQQAQQPSRALRTLDAHAAATVTAAAERIIPASDTPGATRAGVTAFIDTMLSDWYAPADSTRFLAGLADLDARSRTRHGRAFIECLPADQDVMLDALDNEVVALRRASGASANDHWFAMLKYLTVWGYCTSEAGMRETLHSYPAPMRYDGAAPIRS
jgi:gluconate 2-dehydrogenase gamma chain